MCRDKDGYVVEVRMVAADQDLFVPRVEGGIGHHPGFEARLDCIWDGADPPLSPLGAALNNRKAADFIREERGEHDTLVITAPPLSRWPHRRT